MSDGMKAAQSAPEAGPRSALGGMRADGLVTVTELDPQGMITLRGDLSDSTITAALSATAGVAMPKRRQTVTEGTGGLLWMSPDEAMLLCPYDEVSEKLAALQSALGDAHALAVDVSDARAVFRLEGAACRDVLAKLTPADLRPQSLPVGELRRTRLAQVAGAFWFRDDETMDLICFRSVAGYVFDLLRTAADPDSAVGML